MNSQFTHSLAVLLVGAGGALSGCGSSEPPPAPPPPPVKDTAFGTMVGTLDRARGVEATTQQQKEAVDRAIEQSEGAAGAP